MASMSMHEGAEKLAASCTLTRLLLDNTRNAYVCGLQVYKVTAKKT